MSVSNSAALWLSAVSAACLLNACATAPQRGPAPPYTHGPVAESAPEPAPEAPASEPKPPPPAPEAPAESPAPAAPPARLAWVNPARCLSSCAFDPGDALERVNEHGDADPKGRHRVDRTALPALRELLAAARAAGHVVKISSAYRSYDDQVRVFRTTKEKGRAARPGHSEHQLGTAIDLRLPTTRAIDWLAAHVAGHGFVLSYPPGKQRLTGYRPEPWHVRFVGRAIAAGISAGESLEELFRRRPELAESGGCADCPAPTSRKACGRVSAQGACEGTVLSWCYDGALATVDCATFKSTCASSPNGTPDCLPAPDAVETPPETDER